MTKRTNRIVYAARIAFAAVVLAISLQVFIGLGNTAAVFFRMQTGPAFVKTIGNFSAGAAAIGLLSLLLSFCFGRFYCSMICPFGILQEGLSWPLRHRKRNVPDLPWLRYFFAGFVFIPFFAGTCRLFGYLAPYSNFGRVTAAFFSGGAVILCILIFLLIWKKRIWCTAICPIGTLLGVVAKHGLFRLEFSGKCIRCGKCADFCPTSCMNPKEGIIDNERCIRCLECLINCPVNAVQFAGKTKKKVPFIRSRRDFLRNSGMFLAGAAAGSFLVKARRFIPQNELIWPRILPPGAGSARRFSHRCTFCQLCIVSCPEKIIRHRDGSIFLNLDKGACQYNCHRCSEVCPTGAILPLTLQIKQKTQIGEAVFHPQNCIVFQNDEPCGKCAKACPTGAIKLRKNGTPLPVKTELCIGCGACQKVCPAEKKAMTVHGIEEQKLIKKIS